MAMDTPSTTVGSNIPAAMIPSPSDYRRQQLAAGVTSRPNRRARKIPPLSTAPTSTRVLLAFLALLLLAIAAQFLAAFF